jgi:4-hydroxy-tetrahydrodipicolinate synthase
MLTPLKEDGTPDRAGFEALAERAVRGGVHGLFTLGSCGEGHCFSQTMRLEIAAEARRALAGRLPLLVGVLEPSTGRAIEAIRGLMDAGCDSFVVPPPYYLKSGQGEILRHFEAIARTRCQLVLYNIPQFTGVAMTADTLWQLSQIGNVVAIKDSDPDWQAVKRGLMRTRGTNVSFMLGHEDNCGEGMLLGGDGMVPSLANAYPELFVDLYEAGGAGNIPEVIRLTAKVARLRSIVGPEVNWIGCIKYMAARKGLCGVTQPLPFRPLDAAARARVDAALGAFEGEEGYA